ncbi:unnamed protein product [Rhizoctonia solani]|uniref:Hydrophobin n=1 Tax=Rhizoctonia solani TaxID=456999 RepID=A0A8H2WX22_9AGAM|nr:unnamed protein product [Rhizoctonia solani]
MIRSPLARLLAIAFVLLAFTMVVWSAPVETGKNLIARGGTCTIGCTTGNQMLAILLKLKADIDVKLGLLDACYNNGTDPAGIIADIVALINAANIASHCGKWSDKPHYDAFLTLIVVIDVALKALLSATCGLLGTLLGLIANLLGGVNLALLLKVKFYACTSYLGY